MPKQFIHCRDFGRQVPISLDGDGDRVELRTMPQHVVKVGWSKESGDVQLAVLHDRDGALVEHGFPSELGFDAGDITEIDDPTDRELLARMTPLYIDLDRQGLNQLIRALRKARDDAFGADA